MAVKIVFKQGLSGNLPKLDVAEPAFVTDRDAERLYIGGNSENISIANKSDVDKHTDDTDNPHQVTKAQVGLGNVPNVATNDQTPTYTAAPVLDDLKSGEKLNVGFGKLSKAVSELISHIDSSTLHVTQSDRDRWDGLAGISEIIMNGSTKGKSGTVDLGTVLTEHQDISGKADKSETVTEVAWDTVSKKLTRTINGAPGDVVTIDQIREALDLKIGDITIADVPTPSGGSPSSLAPIANNSSLTEAIYKLSEVISFLTEHLADQEGHITDEEREAWNAKTDNIGTVTQIILNGKTNDPNASGVVDLGTILSDGTTVDSVSFTEAQELSTLSTGESLSALFGKIAKAVRAFIAHDENTNIHVTSAEKSKWNAKSGTVAAVKANGETLNPDGDGVVDIGAVLAEHQDISGKADKAETVTDVVWDEASKKLTKTINGETEDVVSAETLMEAMNLSLLGDGVVKRVIVNGTGKVPDASGEVNLGTVLTEHQDVSGKADKAETVSRVAWDTSKKELTQTINGDTATVVTLGELVSGIELPEAGGGVTGVKVNGTERTPDEHGVVDLGTVLTEHQDVSSKAEKSETVSNVVWDVSNKKLVQVIDGDALDVVTAESLKAALELSGEDVDIDVNDAVLSYSVSETLAALSSGETVSAAFGKLAKAVSDLINHKADSSVHISASDRQAWNAKANADSVVTNVVWDNVNQKLTKTIGGSSIDVLTLAALRAALKVGTIDSDPTTGVTSDDSLADAIIKLIDAINELSAALSGHSSDGAVHTTAAERTNWNNKVDKVEGKGLSSNDFTDELKEKLEGLEASGSPDSSVTGVKGSAESSYRGGNVELSLANLGVTWGNTDLVDGVSDLADGRIYLYYDGSSNAENTAEILKYTANTMPLGASVQLGGLNGANETPEDVLPNIDVVSGSVTVLDDVMTVLE